MSDTFYRDMRSAPTLAALLRDEDGFQPAPDDWVVALCDVKGSTAAIGRGLYREVNMVGVGFLVGLINAWRADAMPFAFGGDGALALLPPHRADAAQTVCLRARRIASEAFGFELRTHVLTVREICGRGAAMLVGKVRWDKDHAPLAAFSGGGAAAADAILKSTEIAAASDAPIGDAAFSGLTCPWRPVAPPEGEIASLLVSIDTPSLPARHARYAAVIDAIAEILESDPPRNPVSADALRFTADARQARSVGLIVGGGEGADGVRSAAWAERLGVAGKRLRSRWTDWIRRGRTLRDAVAGDVDYLRFDDMLRATLHVSDVQRARIETFLRQERARGGLRFGLAFAPAALVTCVLKGADTHFALVDGASGGYAAAASMLKTQQAEEAAA